MLASIYLIFCLTSGNGTPVLSRTAVVCKLLLSAHTPRLYAAVSALDRMPCHHLSIVMAGVAMIWTSTTKKQRLAAAHCSAHGACPVPSLHSSSAVHR